VTFDLRCDRVRVSEGKDASGDDRTWLTAGTIFAVGKRSSRFLMEKLETLRMRGVSSSLWSRQPKGVRAHPIDLTFPTTHRVRSTERGRAKGIVRAHRYREASPFEPKFLQRLGSRRRERRRPC
jgi:hypothetical protein